MSAFFVLFNNSFCMFNHHIDSETSFVVSKPYNTGPTESPTNMISENSSAIFAIGAVYEVKHIKGCFFVTLSQNFCFFFLKTLL